MTSKPKKRLLVTWDQFHTDCRTLTRMLLDINRDWKGMISVTTGGLVPAGIVSWEMDLKLIDVIGISSYAGYDDPNQKDIKVLKNYDADLVGDGTGWLVLDDMVDSGKTIQAIREMLPAAHYAAVYAKPDGEPFVDTYAVAVEQEKWIYFPWYLDTLPTEPIVYDAQK